VVTGGAAAVAVPWVVTVATVELEEEADGAAGSSEVQATASSRRASARIPRTPAR
jgi:hypothetical protein